MALGGSRFVVGRVDSGGNIIRCHIRIADQVDISVRLVHLGKARDADAVVKNKHHHVHQKNNSKALLRPFQQLLSEESSSLRCQGGRMCTSENRDEKHVQRPK